MKSFTRHKIYKIIRYKSKANEHQYLVDREKLEVIHQKFGHTFLFK